MGTDSYYPSRVWEGPVSLPRNCRFGKHLGVFTGRGTSTWPIPVFLNLGAKMRQKGLKRCVVPKQGTDMLKKLKVS